jgi:signal transduction histidine kinase
VPGNIQAISALLASLLIVVIGVSVLLRDRTRRTYTLFAAFTFTLSAWHLCTFLASVTGSDTMRWLSLWPAAAIPPTALAFYREFLAQPSIGGKRRSQRVTLVWTILAYLVLIYSRLVHPIHDSLFFLVPFGVYVFGSLYRCVYDTYVQYRATSKRVERVRVRYVLIGGFVAITLALTDVLPRLGVGWPSVGHAFTILYLYFLSQSLFRYQLIDINELLGKMAVLGTLVALLWAVYGLLLAWIGRGQEGLFLLNALVSSFVILILYEPVRTRLESGIHRWLLRQRDELRGRIERLRRELLRVTHVDEMATLILTALEESRRVTHASVYLLDFAGTGYDLKGYYGAAPIERIESVAYRALVARLRASDEHYVDRDETQRLGDESRGAPGGDPDDHEAVESVLRQLDTMNADLVFPMFGSAETEQGPWLLGLLAVRDARTESAFDRDDVTLFRQLAAQAARCIEASEAFTRVKERERLAAIGELSAGLAHEIRNPLGAIKGAAQLLVGPDGTPVEPSGESAEFVKIIIEEVDRLNHVVTQFLDYARSGGDAAKRHRPLDLNDVVRKTAQLLGRDAPRNVEIRVQLDELLPPVAGDAAPLLQVFLNLGQNAIQAMERTSGGTLDIITTRRRRSRLGYGSFAEVRFRDTGVGVAPEALSKLFIPFFTTREKGTGLGLAISERIVSEHGGTIEVHPNPERGATFSVYLPALGPSRPPTQGEPAGETAGPQQPVE